MTRRVLVVAALGLAACGPLDAQPAAQVATRRDGIVNGHVTFDDPEIFLYESRYGSCSSTLIGRRTLLTAAHCVSDESDRVISAADSWVTNVVDSYRARSRDYIRVTALRRHPGYVPIGLTPTAGFYSQNDVAMLQLEREPPVPLKAWNADPLTDDQLMRELRLVGYGDTKAGSGFGLKRTGVSVLQAIRPIHISYNRLEGVNGGTCQGDSGGPSLLSFPDGSERVVGVTSYGPDGCVGASTDARVDAYAGYIKAGLALYESTCAADGFCKQGCAAADPDCACVADGQCIAACVAPSIDPDCGDACGNDGVCATTLAGCAAPDPDCQALGAGCGYEAHCASRLCVTSAQHARPYCTRSCAQPADCPGDMECTAGECRFRLRPTAALGEACTPGVTLCEGGSSFCGSWDTQPATHCAQGCLEDADCRDGTCRASPEGPSLCVPNVMFTRLGTENSVVQGCASVRERGGVPAGLLLGLVALVGLARRRARATPPVGSPPDTARTP